MKAWALNLSDQYGEFSEVYTDKKEAENMAAYYKHNGKKKVLGIEYLPSWHTEEST